MDLVLVAKLLRLGKILKVPEVFRNVNGKTVERTWKNRFQELIEKFLDYCFYTVVIKTIGPCIYVEIQVYNLSNAYSESEVPLS